MFESWIGGSIKVISVDRGEITAIVDRSGLRGVDLSGPAAQAHGLREFGAVTSEELACLGELDSAR
jgi:hypothetical protein